jgi:hypothetical protein
MSFSVRALIGMTDRVSRPLENINKNIRRTLAPIERLKRARINLSRSLGIDGLGRSLGRLRGQAAGALGPLTAITAGLSVAGIVNFTQRYSEAGDQFAKTAKLMGLSAETYQELQFAAERSGVAQGTFTQSMTAFTKRLGEAKQGTGSLFTFMEKLDPSIRKNVLAADSTEEAFRRLTFAMSHLESEEDRAALASAAFSRAGLGMVNMMSEGNGAVDSLRQEIRDLGGVMSGEAARDAEAYRDAVTNFQTALGGLGNLIGSKIIPALTPFLERITESVAKFTQSDEAMQGMERIAGKLSEVLAGFSFTAFLNGVESVVTAITGAVEFVGGWENALIGLGVVMNGPLIGAIVAVTGVIAKLGVVLLANPIGLAVAAIGAAVYVIYENWDPIKKWFTDLWSDVEALFKSTETYLTDTFGANFSDVARVITGAWKGTELVFKTLLSGVSSAFKEAWKVIKPIVDLITSSAKAVSDITSSISVGPMPANQKAAETNVPIRSMFGGGTTRAAPAVEGPMTAGANGGRNFADGTVNVEVRVKADQGTSVPGTRLRSSGNVRASTGRTDADLIGAN